MAKNIDSAIRASAIVIVVLSRAAHASLYVNYEWAFALGSGARVIPLLRERLRLHPRLSSLQFVDFTKPGKKWLRLNDAVERLLLHGGPTIRAAFELDGGEPVRVGREYVVLLSIDRVPRRATAARYELHDDSFEESTWTKRNPKESFDTRMQSYGDVPISVTFKTSTGSVPTVTTSLFDALRRTHGRSGNRAIRRALRYIEEH
jgi:hypothetical protein